MGSFIFLGKRRLRQDLVCVCEYLMRGNEDDGARLFSLVPSDRTRGSGHKLKQRELHLNTGNFFFSFEGNQRLNRLPREVVESSVEIFKA